MYTTTTPTMIKMIEIGLRKKHYTPHDNAQKWHRNGEIGQEIYGGGTVWLPPENSKTETNAIAIYYDIDNPCIAIVPEADLEAVIAEMNATLDTINGMIAHAVDTVSSAKSNAAPMVTFDFDPANAHPILTIDAMVKSYWAWGNDTATPPEPHCLRRFFSLVVPETAHYQIISVSSEEHIAFLHADHRLESPVIAGGEPSIAIPGDPEEKKRTSFDLTLAPGHYLYEIYAYNFTGQFSIKTKDDCTTEPERPFMFDDDGVDAFGYAPPQAVDMSDIYLMSDGYRSITALKDGQLQALNSAYLQNFTEIEFYGGSALPRLQRLKFAGNTALREIFEKGEATLEGYNAGYQQIMTLNQTVEPLGINSGYIDPADWIIDTAFNPPLTGYSKYRIKIPEKNPSHKATELMLYK